MTALTSKSLRGWGASCVSLFVLWIALVGSRDALELAVGVAAAAVGAVVVSAVRSCGGFPTLVFRRRTWSRAVSTLARIPRDLRLLAGGFRSAGSYSTLSLPPGTDWRHRAERGLVELFGSVAPNAILFDASADGTAQAHELIETDEGPLP